MWCNTSGINETVHSKENKFYIGDPCYVLREDLYEVWCGTESGLFSHEGTPIMAVDDTATGDGFYPGIGYNCDNADFGVDAGALAVIPLEYCDHDKLAQQDDLFIVETMAGTGVNLITHGEDDSKPGSFLFSWTNPDGSHAHIDIRTREEEEEDPSDDEDDGPFAEHEDDEE